jgi:hypothetical protein
MPKVLLFVALVLTGCSQSDGPVSNAPPLSGFGYEERDAIHDDVPLPKGGLYQRPIVGVKKVLVSVVHWQDGDTLNDALIQKHTLSHDPDSLRSYILAASLEKLTLDGTLISSTSGPRPDLCKSGSPFPMSLALAEGEKAAKAAGLDPDDFDYLINVIDCGGGAAAFSPGRIMGVYGQSDSPHVYKHEFGHNLGYAHGATYTRCPKQEDTVKTPLGCTETGYGDTGDTVSGGGTLYPAYNRWWSGWLDETQAVTISHTGLYRLGVLGRSDPQLYLINVPADSTTVTHLSLEYRKPTPYDNFPPTDNRVTGVWARYSSKVYYNSKMVNRQVDATPQTPTTTDPTLQPGQTLKDDTAGITVHVCDAPVSDSGISISVGIKGETPPTCASELVPVKPKNADAANRNSLLSGSLRPDGTRVSRTF